VPNQYRTHDREMKNCAILSDEGIEETFWHMDHFLSRDTEQHQITWCTAEEKPRVQDSEATSTPSQRLPNHRKTREHRPGRAVIN
jgi:hypothetical protein